MFRLGPCTNVRMARALHASFRRACACTCQNPTWHDRNSARICCNGQLRTSSVLALSLIDMRCRLCFCRSRPSAVSLMSPETGFAALPAHQDHFCRSCSVYIYGQLWIGLGSGTWVGRLGTCSRAPAGQNPTWHAHISAVCSVEPHLSLTPNSSSTSYGSDPAALSWRSPRPLELSEPLKPCNPFICRMLQIARRLQRHSADTEELSD